MFDRNNNTNILNKNMHQFHRANQPVHYHPVQQPRPVRVPAPAPVQHPQPVSIPISSILEKNQRLQQANRCLTSDFQRHLQDDWEGNRGKNDKLEYLSRHVAVLQKIAEEIASSMSAYDGISSRVQGSSQNLNKDESIESQYNILVQSIQKWSNCPRDLREQIMTQLGSYHCKSMLLYSQVEASKATIQLKEEEIDQLDQQLTAALNENKSICNQLLESNLQIRNLQQQTARSATVQSSTSGYKKQHSQMYSTQHKEISPRDQASPAPEKDLYVEIRKCYEEISILKEQLRESQSSEKNKRNSFESSKARLELDCLLYQKKYEESESEVRDLKERLRHQKVDDNPEHPSRDYQLYEDEINHLRIKILSLESLQVIHSSRCTFSSEAQIDGLLQKLEPLLHGPQKMKGCLRLMAQIYAMIKELGEKVEESEGEMQRMRKKGRSYRAKYIALYRKKSEQDKDLISSYKAKYNDYNRLIEKMQIQLQRTIDTDKQSSLQQTIELAIAPIQHQLEVSFTHVSFLKKELSHKEPAMLRLQNTVNELTHRIQILTQQNSNLLKGNRQNQKQLLERNLSERVERVRTVNQVKVETVTANTYNPQIHALQQHIKVLESQLQEQKDLLQKQKNHSQHLTTRSDNLHKHIEYLQAQFTVIHQKHQRIIEVDFDVRKNINVINIESGQVSYSDKKIDKNHTQVKALRQEMSLLKSQMISGRKSAVKESEDAEEENLSYKNRVEELEELLRVIDNEKDDKIVALNRVQRDNNDLIKQINMMEEEIQVLKGKGGSLKELDMMEEKRSLQVEKKQLQKEIKKNIDTIKAQAQQIEVLRRECDSFLEDNLKLELTIKQNKIEIKDSNISPRKYEKIQEEVKNKVYYLQQKNESLNLDNQVLKSLVQEMRIKVVSSPHLAQDKSSSSQQQLRMELSRAKIEIGRYKNENETLREKHDHEKEQLQQNWSRLVTDLNNISEELEQYKRAGAGSRPLSEVDSMRDDHFSIDNFQDEKIVKSQVIDLMSQLEIKNQMIYQLRDDLQKERRKQGKVQIERYVQTQAQSQPLQSGDVPQELSELREANQKLRQANFSVRRELRNLENEYNSLRLQLLSNSGSAQNLNFGSAPYIEAGRPSPPLLQPQNNRLQTLHSQSQRSSHSSPDDASFNRKREQSRMAGSQPMMMLHEKQLLSMAPLVESVKEGND